MDQNIDADIVPGYFIDLVSFILAYDAYISLKGEDDPLVAEAHPIVRRLFPEIIRGLEKYIVPVVAQSSMTMFVPVVTRAIRNSRSIAQVRLQAEALRLIFDRLKTNRTMLESMLADNRAINSAVRVASAASSDDAATILNILASVPSASKLRVTRNWIRDAAAAAGVGATLVESAIADATMAQDLGANLRSIDTDLASMDPTSPEAVALQARRTDVIATVNDLVDESRTPDVVLSAAIGAATSQSTYQTQTGKAQRLSPDQERAMMIRGKGIMAAGAGSGKTRVLASKVAYHVNELGVPPEAIMATSFSRKSAAELGDRISKFGVSIPSSARAGFGTTHSIAAQLLREYGRETTNESLESYEQNDLIRLAMEQVQMGDPSNAQKAPKPTSLFQGLSNTPTKGEQGPAEPEFGPTFRQALEQTFSRRTKLVPFHRGFIEGFFNTSDTWYSRTMRVTNNLTNPMGLSEKQQDILMIIFRQLGIQYNPEMDPTYQGMLRSGKVAGSRKDKNMAAKYKYFANPAQQWFNIGMNLTVDGKKESDPIPPGQFKQAITKFKGKLISPSEAWDQFQSPEAAVYAAYDWLKGPNGEDDLRNKGDFDDLLINISKMMLSNPRAMKQIQGRFKVVLVDEAQDLNRSQHLMFGLITGYVDPKKVTAIAKAKQFAELSHEDGHMTADTYCFIGDDKQAIYTFRGADPDTFIDMSDLVEGGAGFKTMVLKTNYRSGAEIVKAANNIIRHNTKQIPMVCDANPNRADVGAVKVKAFTATVKGDMSEAAEWFADMIQEKMEREAPESGYDGFGLGVRSNAEAYAYGLELLKRGIPFRSKTNFFSDPTTKAVIHWLTIADEGFDGNTDRVNEAVLNARTAPTSMLGASFTAKLTELATGNYLTWLLNNWTTIYGATGRWASTLETYVDNLTFIAGMKGRPIKDIYEAIMALSGVGGASIEEALADKVRSDADVMSEIRSASAKGEIDDALVLERALAPLSPLKGLMDSRADLTEAMTYVRTLQQANSKLATEDDPKDPRFKRPAVTLGTMHSWKGLEVGTMFVPFVGGTFPRSDADEEALADDRRLAYVAITRGENEVHIMDIPVAFQTKSGTVVQRSQFVGEACIPPSKGADAAVDNTETYDEDGMGKVGAEDFLPLPEGGSYMDPDLLDEYLSGQSRVGSDLERNWGRTVQR